jgi:hypothetical protein
MPYHQMSPNIQKNRKSMGDGMFRRCSWEVLVFAGDFDVGESEVVVVGFDELFAFDAEGFFFEVWCEGVDGFFVECAEAALAVGEESAVAEAGDVVEDAFADFSPGGHFGGVAGSESEGDVVCVVGDGVEEVWYFVGVVLSVAVEGDDIVVVVIFGVGESCFDGCSFALVGGVGDDGCACLSGDVCGVVGASVVDDEDGVDVGFSLFNNHFDGLIFIVARYNRNGSPRKKSRQLIASPLYNTAHFIFIL